MIPRENIEWQDIWVTGADDGVMPRALFVGDSIARSYFAHVEEQLKGIFLCARMTTSTCVADKAFEKELGLVLDNYRFAVIHFNNGLHGWGFDETSYANGLSRVLAFIVGRCPRSSVILANTTPVRRKDDISTFAPDTDRVRERNRLACDIAATHKVPVNDLYGCVADHPEYFTEDGVHFNLEGQRVLAKQVARIVLKEGNRGAEPTRVSPMNEAKPLAQLQEEFLQWRFGSFIHFGMATFHDMQWATGHEDPATFAPTSLDCGQWADAALAAGMTYAVLTVKHTSGWCLWQSDTTTHGMQAFTNYQNGKGDLFREFVDAFRARGMKVGFYYCLPGNYVAQPGLPPERQILPPGKPDLHGLPPEALGADPVAFMKTQFTELLTRYGRIDEVWIDQGGQEKHALHAHIKSLQPNCVVLLNNAVGDVAGFELPNVAGLDGAKKSVGQTPAEVADCINPDGSWFWQKAMESNLLTAAEIVDRLRYFTAQRANYLLDVPPDTTGLLPPIFVERLQEVGKLLRSSNHEQPTGDAP